MVETEYTAGDLTSESWDDFERFFDKYNGVQDCCWCTYYHLPGPFEASSGDPCAEKRELRKRLVGKGVSRAVLIYSGCDVVASCQYGTADELPRIEGHRRYSSMLPVDSGEKLWRITCFFVDRQHRHRGLTHLALREVLDRISKSGGGVVEAYPAMNDRAVEQWFGQLKTYMDAGFHIVSDYGRNNALVRMSIPPRK